VTLGGDRITLIGLRVQGWHGVHEYERRNGQEFVVDATVWLDLAPAADTDALPATLDYDALAGRAAQIVSKDPCNLIETVAARIATDVLSDQRVQAVEITIHKPAAPLSHPFTDVAVTIHRCRDPAP
jgi:7,8-dihydroneopterin aldolase/epimerase/oxygenase